jgi:hypothetical protein
MVTDGRDGCVKVRILSVAFLVIVGGWVLWALARSYHIGEVPCECSVKGQEPSAQYQGGSPGGVVVCYRESRRAAYVAFLVTVARVRRRYRNRKRHAVFDQENEHDYEDEHEGKSKMKAEPQL